MSKYNDIEERVDGLFTVLTKKPWTAIALAIFIASTFVLGRCSHGIIG